MFRLGATLFAVFLTTLAFPPGPYPYVALIAMVPFFLALMGTGPLMGALLGFVYGFFLWLSAIWWIQTGAVNWIGVTPLAGWGIAIAFVAFQALPYIIFGLIQGWLGINKSGLPTFMNSILLTVCIGFFPSVLPGSIVHSFYSTPLVIQLADIGGTHLLFWIIILINLLIASLVYKICKRQPCHMPVLFLAIIIGSVCFYGRYRIDEYTRLAKNAPAGEFIKIVAIQPNIPIKSQRNDNEFLQETIGFTANFVNQHSADADLVVWPEVPIPMCQDSCRLNPARNI